MGSTATKIRSRDRNTALESWSRLCSVSVLSSLAKLRLRCQSSRYAPHKGPPRCEITIWITVTVRCLFSMENSVWKLLRYGIYTALIQESCNALNFLPLAPHTWRSADKAPSTFLLRLLTLHHPPPQPSLHHRTARCRQSIYPWPSASVPHPGCLELSRRS